jgi:signal transduction histidine kinase
METPQNNRTLSALARLARAVSGGEFRARVLLSRVCDAVADAFDFRRVAIFRYSPETNMIVPFAAHGAEPEQAGRVPAAPLDLVPIFERALAEGKAVQSVAVAEEGGLRPQAAAMLGVESLAVAPLISEGNCLGFLACDRAGERFELDRGELDLLSMLGTLTAVLLEKAVEQSQLRRLNELKSEFIALASHELRTPAAVIYGISETLRLRGDEIPAASREELAQALYAQAGRLRHLVEQLLDLSRLEAEAVRIEPQLLVVREHLQAIVTAVAPSPEAVDVQVPVDLSVLVDPVAFDRIVSNLVTNALRYGEPPVVVRSELRDGDMCVVVEDRGPGVPEEFVPRLFERFSRAESERRREGAGLGLSIAQSYAQAHGGHIAYVPAEPHGARFELVLPAQ